MTKLIKILVILTLLIFTGCEDKPITVIVDNSDYMKKMDPRLKAYPEAVEWYGNAEIDKVSTFNIGVIYHKKIKDYINAVQWYKKAYSQGYLEAALGLGTVYEDLKEYEKSIKWYIKSNSKNSLNNLGLLYDIKLKDSINAIKYYKMAVERESIESITSIANLYHEQKDNVKASAYLITLLEYPTYTKKEILNYLKNDLKIDNETIKKGYELQLTMPGLPRRYTGGI